MKTLIWTVLSAVTIIASPHFVKADNVPVTTPKGMDTLSSLCLGTTPGGQPVKGLSLGTAIASPYEVFSLQLTCNIIPSYDPTTFQVTSDQLTFSSEFDQSLTQSDYTFNIAGRPASVVVMDGTLKGQYNETVSSDDVANTQVDASDIVTKNLDGSVVVKRGYREIYVITELGDSTTANDDNSSTHVVQRYILELNGKGQPVIRTDEFSSTVDPDVLAGAIGGNSSDYISGIYIVQSAAASLNSCVLSAGSTSSNISDPKDCLTNPQPRKIALPIGDQYFAGLPLLGWQQNHIPTNNTASWYSNRVDFSEVLSELIANSAALATSYKPSDAAVAAWIKDAKDAISQANN